MKGVSKKWSAYFYVGRDNTHLPTCGIYFKRLARQQEIELNTSAFLVAHTCEQSSILKVYGAGHMTCREE